MHDKDKFCGATEMLFFFFLDRQHVDFVKSAAKRKEEQRVFPVKILTCSLEALVRGRCGIKKCVTMHLKSPSLPGALLSQHPLLCATCWHNIGLEEARFVFYPPYVETKCRRGVINHRFSVALLT